MSNGQWNKVAEDVFHRRYEPLDVSIGLVVGPTGSTIIDTRNNPAEAEEIIMDVAQCFGQEIVAVINTHAHYDHTFGNQVFKAAGIPIYGHYLVPDHFERYEKPHLARVKSHPAAEPDKSWQDVILTPPTVLIEERELISVGGRDIELIPLAAGHTDSDLAIHIPDAGVWFLGDIIEESGPPMFGSGAHPLGWPGMLTSLLDDISDSHVIIPGHGRPVERSFVIEQLKDFQLLAQEIRSAHTARIPAERIDFSVRLLHVWPEEFLREAAKDGYREIGD